MGSTDIPIKGCSAKTSLQTAGFSDCFGSHKGSNPLNMGMGPCVPSNTSRKVNAWAVTMMLSSWSSSDLHQLWLKIFIDKGVVLNLPMKHRFANLETKNTPLNPS